MAHQRYGQRNDKGFTLIEVMFSFLIISILAVPLFAIYANQATKKRVDATYSNVAAAVTALQRYRDTEGHFPCPAPLDRQRGTPGYGAELKPVGVDACEIPAVGSCVNGVCARESVSELGEPVLVGALPFRDLQLEEDMALDGEGRRLVYAISSNMTSTGTYYDYDGLIDVRDANGDSVISPDGTVSFLVLAPGDNGAGAYNRQGLLINPCAGAGNDIQNCDDLNSAVAKSAVFNAMPRSLGSPATYYDDIVEYYSGAKDKAWRRLSTDPADGTNFNRIIDTKGEGVAINVDDLSALPSALLHIGADDTMDSAVIKDGKLYTDEICNMAGECFSPRKIAAKLGDPEATGPGDPDGAIRCPEGQFMAGIDQGHAICVTPDAQNLQAGCSDTPETPVLRGFDNNGQPICTVMPSDGCQNTEVSICGGSATLHFGAPGDESEVFQGTPDDPTYGYCHRAQFTCVDGQWTQTLDVGSCTETATTTSGGHLCSERGSQYDTSVTNTYEIEHYWQCNELSSHSLLYVEQERNLAPSQCECKGAHQGEDGEDEIFYDFERNCSGGIFTNADGTTYTGYNSGVAIRPYRYTGEGCSRAYEDWDVSGCVCAPPEVTGLDENGAGVVMEDDELVQYTVTFFGDGGKSVVRHVWSSDADRCQWILDGSPDLTCDEPEVNPSAGIIEEDGVIREIVDGLLCDAGSGAGTGMRSSIRDFVVTEPDGRMACDWGGLSYTSCDCETPDAGGEIWEQSQTCLQAGYSGSGWSGNIEKLYDIVGCSVQPRVPEETRDNCSCTPSTRMVPEPVDPEFCDSYYADQGGSICFEPDDDNIYEEAVTLINPMECEYARTGNVIEGSCKPKRFQWRFDEGGGRPWDNNGVQPSIRVGDACTCDDFRSGEDPTCYVVQGNDILVGVCECQ